MNPEQKRIVTIVRMRNYLVLQRGDVLKVAAMYLMTLAVLVAISVAKLIWHGILMDMRVAALVSLFVGLAVPLGALFVYIVNSRKKLVYSKKTLMALCFVVMLTFAVNTFAQMYDLAVIPIALAAFLAAPITQRRDGFVTNIICVLMIVFALMVENNVKEQIQLTEYLPLALTGILGGSLISYNISTNTKRIDYILKGVCISAACYMLMLVGIMLDAGLTQLLHALPLVGIAIFVQIVLGLLLQPIIETIFNLLTNARIVELTDHNAPLIRRLIDEAPGTFNHCLAVANFAEICASAIGENPTLARACAYYHDIGKLVNPKYFKENQADYNPHDELLPELSADIIRNHTLEGLELCRRYRIPQEIAEVTVQHHGTLPIIVFYNKARSLTDSPVDIAEYSYANPTPTSKIAAIIMLCDSGEAAIRAMDDPNGERVDALMRTLIADRIRTGQFDNCDITLRDLDVIRTTIVNIYGGLFHSRIKY